VGLSEHLRHQATKLVLGRYFCPQYRHGGALMPNQEHIQILLSGVEVWNEWRLSHGSVLPDLTQAELAGKELSKYLPLPYLFAILE
jgi:hypothetical protein